jgi:hypothetical protein
MRALVMASLALAVLGCETERATIEDACANLCVCGGATLPSLERSCTADCVARVGDAAVPQSTIDCFAASDCIDLRLGDDVCELEGDDE